MTLVRENQLWERKKGRALNDLPSIQQSLFAAGHAQSRQKGVTGSYYNYRQLHHCAVKSLSLSSVPLAHNLVIVLVSGCVNPFQWVVCPCQWCENPFQWVVCPCQWRVDPCQWVVCPCQWCVNPCQWGVCPCQWCVNPCQ